MGSFGAGAGRSPGGGLLLVLAALASAPPARGGDIEYDTRSRAAVSAAATRITAFGNWCRGRSYKSLARQQYEEAIRIDPEGAAARAALGHRLEGGRWKIPPGAPDAVDPAGSSPAVLALVEKEAESAYAAAGAAMADLASWCSAGGSEPEATEAWKTVNRLDPGHSAARKALGLAAADTAWLKPWDEGPAAFEVRAKKAAAEGLRRSQESRSKDPGFCVTEWGTGWSESKEARFSVRSTTPRAQSPVLIDDMVHAEGLWTGLGVVDPRRGDEPRLRIVAAGNQEEYVALVDAVPGMDEAWKAPLRKTGGCWASRGLYYTWGWEGEWLRDTAVHNTSHHLLSVPWTLQPWIYEGAGVLASSLLRGKARASCIALDESAFPRGGMETLDWNGEVRKLVQRGEDPPMANLMIAGTNDLGLPMILKARSMVAWMAARSPSAFRAVLAGSTKGAVPEEILRRAFGAPPEAVERRWRTWVRRP